MLKQYKFKIIYISEKNNDWADILSKKTDLIKNKNKTVISILNQFNNKSFIFTQLLYLTMYVVNDKFIIRLIINTVSISDNKSRKFIKNK